MDRIHKHALALLLLMLSIFIGVLIYISLSNPKINPLSAQKNKSKENDNNKTKIESLKNWEWNYTGDVDASDDYPLVVLRFGYKYLKNNGKNATFGWKYEVINTSDKDLYVTVNYKITDQDDFELGNSTKREIVRAANYHTIQDTIIISVEDINRIAGDTWNIIIEPDYKLSDIKEKGNRLERAARIIKEKEPLWVKSYLEWDLNNPFFDLFPKWVTIAKVLGVEKDKKIEEILKKVGITTADIPAWKEIKQLSTYQSLSKEEKDKLVHWLGLQLQFGDYDPQEGYHFDWDKFKPVFD